MTAEHEPNYDDEPYREPNPEDHPDFERYEAERYMRSLSPLGRVRYRVSGLIWRYTWHWRIK